MGVPTRLSPKLRIGDAPHPGLRTCRQLGHEPDPADDTAIGQCNAIGARLAFREGASPGDFGLGRAHGYARCARRLCSRSAIAVSSSLLTVVVRAGGEVWSLAPARLFARRSAGLSRALGRLAKMPPYPKPVRKPKG